MKMIKPIVNISKIVENYDTILLGFNGVLTEGSGVRPEAVEALINIRKYGKKIILISNSSARVVSIARFLHENKIPLALFDSIVSAGEILHYKLKSGTDIFGALGGVYYQLGSQINDGVFAGLPYQQVENLEHAHFMYMNAVAHPEDIMEKYLPFLEHAAALNLPFVCAGNDTSCFINGKIALAPGAFAEQYAILGGRIITLGKPDIRIFKYALDSIGAYNPARTLMIGDNVATDIKGANMLGIDAALITKGVHVNYLGEGYIPDVAKARELASNYDVYPDYVISNLRW